MAMPSKSFEELLKIISGPDCEPTTFYYQNFNGDEGLARCPKCKNTTTLSPTTAKSDELGVTWFRCKCGKMFKAPGLYQKITR
jgi:hypothetical protein